MTQVEAVQEIPHWMVTEAMINERDWARGAAPFFRVDAVSKVFFGMSASWLRLKLKADEEHPETWFTWPDGSRMNFRRSNADRSDSSRVFTLADIQPMTLSLYRYGSIDAQRLAMIYRIIQAVAILYKLMPPESEEDQAAE